MKTIVKYDGRKMEARDHSKKRGASERPSNRVNFLILTALAFIVAFGSCNKEPMYQDDDFRLTGDVKSDVENCVNVGFDPTASYVTKGNDVDGWNQVQDHVNGAPHTTYNFFLLNEAGERFESFCGNYGSGGIGPIAGIDYLEPDHYADIVGVFNYINNKYGSINQWSFASNNQGVGNPNPAANTKLIAQYAIWQILEKGLTMASGTVAIDEAVADALANGKKATGKIDIYFMVGPNYPHDILGVQPQIVPVCKEDPKGEIKIAKTVDGIEINAWAKAAGKKITDLIVGFKLYEVGEEGASIDGVTPIDTKNVDANGVINFTGLASGWYAIEEVLTTSGKAVFYQAPVMYVLIENGEQVEVTIEFDYDAFYTIVNGYGGGYVLGYPGLNNTGDIFPIGVTNTKTGAVYPSFCANAGSEQFAGSGQNGTDCAGYYKTENFHEGANYLDFVKAYNYIQDNYGDLDQNRAITQIVTWNLLKAIEIPSAAFDNIDWAAVEAGTWAVAGIADAKAKVEAVVKNYAFYQGMGKIINVVFMECEHHHDYKFCQPQLVPVYGAPSFKNRTKPPVTASYGTVTATNAGNVPAIKAGLNPKNGNPIYEVDKKTGVVTATPFVVPNANHFVFAQMTRAELEAGVVLEFLVGNKYDVVGTGFVQLVGENIVLTINKFFAGEFGLIAFNKLPVFNNGIIHSQKEKDLKAFGAMSGFNHDNKASVPCPTGDEIWLYFHAGGLQFYK